MAKHKLDSAFCTTATCPPGKRKETFWDTAIPGFVLEVRPNGSGTYALRYIDDYGTQRQLKIGARGVVTFDDARKAARKLRSKVELGGDPAAAKAVKKAVPTYDEVADQHLAHARTYQKRPDNLETTLRCHIRPRWAKERISDITPQAIAQWLADLRTGGLAPATVEKIRVTFHRSFELAMKWGLAGADKNPVHAVPRPKFDNRKERFLSAEEASRLVAACDQSENPFLKPIVQLLLFTGARKMELLKARWAHVDIEQRRWRIPDSKTGKARYVPLSQAAIDAIGTLPRLNPYLVGNPDTGQPFTDIKHSFTKARTIAGLPNVRIHDLRHSAASFMINAGVDLYAVGKVLGHADYQSTMRYAALSGDTLLKAVEAGAAKLLEVAA